MNPKWRKFAPAGLYLFLAGLLVAAGYYVVERTFGLPFQISLGVAVVGLALFALLDPQRVREALTGRQARYGSNALVMTLAFLGILVVVNYLVYHHSYRWDLTVDKLNTLTPETLQTLESLSSPVEAQAFFTTRLSTESAQKLLQQYKVNGQGKFDYQFIDPEAQPVLAQAAKITRDGTIVLKMGDRQEPVTYVSEQEVTSALIRLANPGERAVYFLTGHGEYDPDGSGEESYSQVKQTLETKNYTVSTLNLLSDPAIPEDALAVIIAGPRKLLSNKEVSLLSDYLAKGGSLVLLSEPPALTDVKDQSDPLAEYLANTWKIQLGNDLVIDPGVNPPVVAISDSYGSHAITEKMQGLATIFPTARSVVAGEGTDNLSLVTLVSASQSSWGETDTQSLETTSPVADPNSDLLGPVPLAVAATDQSTKARVVVVGDSDFASDSYFQNYGDGDFITNIIDWAAEQDNLISLTPKTPTTRVILTPQQYTMGLILLGFVFLLPGMVIASGVLVWLQRRRRG